MVVVVLGILVVVMVVVCIVVMQTCKEYKISLVPLSWNTISPKQSVKFNCDILQKMLAGEEIQCEV